MTMKSSQLARDALPRRWTAIPLFDVTSERIQEIAAIATQRLVASPY